MMTMDNEKKNEIKFDQFLDAVGSGSARSRNIINLMMTAAFVAALGLYNSIAPEYNWLSSRLSSLQNVYFWVLFPDDQPNDSLRIRLVPGGALRDNAFTLSEYRQYFANVPVMTEGEVATVQSIPDHLRITVPACYLRPDKSVQTDVILPQKVSEALHTMEKMGTTNRKELDNLLRTYDRARVEHALMIRIPILGIAFDVNGLAMISTVAFSILFFLLYHSLSRERKNLTLIFRLGEEQQVDNLILYQLLSMQQVLTVPASIDEYIQSAKENRVIQPNWLDMIKNAGLKYFTLIPILGPLLVWSCIYWNDHLTTSIGKSVNNSMTDMTTGISIMLGVPAFIMLLFCVREWWKIDQLWQKEALDIRQQLIGHLLQPPARQ
jgi:hypothetical protein